MCHLAGEVADGVLLNWLTPEHVVRSAEWVRAGAQAATGIQINDPLPANTTFRTGAYNGAASDVSLTVGAGPATYCVAEAGADTNADGCSRTATDLVIGAPALSTVAIGAGNAVTVRFQVTIN